MIKGKTEDVARAKQIIKEEKDSKTSIEIKYKTNPLGPNGVTALLLGAFFFLFVVFVSHLVHDVE